jgi:hypothetical protein
MAAAIGSANNAPGWNFTRSSRHEPGGTIQDPETATPNLTFAWT